LLILKRKVGGNKNFQMAINLKDPFKMAILTEKEFIIGTQGLFMKANLNMG
jgi:hypothetical protein